MYGSPKGVASLAKRLADSNGEFTSSTKITLEEVKTYLEQTSSILNIVLSNNGFIIPIENPDIEPALDAFVNQEVAAIAQGINNIGRFGPMLGSGKQPSGNWLSMIMNDAIKFVSDFAVGFERLGAIREYDETTGIGYATDESTGEAYSPLFTREENWQDP